MELYNVIARGDLCMLEWLNDTYYSDDPVTFYNTVVRGDKYVVEALARRFEHLSPTMWNPIAAVAAAFGHGHILRWMNENDYDWRGTATCALLAYWGDLALFEWACAEHCPCFSDVFGWAIEGWCLTHICEMHLTDVVQHRAARYTCLVLREHGITYHACGNETLGTAPIRPRGHLDIMAYARTYIGERATIPPRQYLLCTILRVTAKLAVFPSAISEDDCFPGFAQWLQDNRTEENTE
jgi:hypothetical protein